MDNLSPNEVFNNLILNENPKPVAKFSIQKKLPQNLWQKK